VLWLTRLGLKNMHYVFHWVAILPERIIHVVGDDLLMQEVPRSRRAPYRLAMRHTATDSC
jgi:hypothetical protein